MSIGDKIVTYFKVKKFNFKEQLQVFQRFYSLKFFLLDFSFFLISLFQNPYRASRKFLQKNYPLKDPYVYGETPLTTMAKIVEECNIGPSDYFLELGSGRAKCCFWLSHFVKCRVVGVEWIPSFVKMGNFLKKLLGYKNLEFIQKDFFQMDLSSYSAIYLYGTCLEDQEIIQICQKLKTLKKETKIITISYPLSDFDDVFILKKSFDVDFPWGKTSCYLNLRK